MWFAYIDPGTGFVVTTLSVWLIAVIVSLIGLFTVFFKKIINFIIKYKWLVILLIVVVGSTVAGVLMRKDTSPLEHRFVILGFDGLSPRIVDTLIIEGKLPHFEMVMNQGTYKRLRTTNPSQSPVAWAGFATGQNPGENGIFDFIVRDPKTYGLDLSLSKIEKGKAQRVIKSRCFWQYTSDKKVPTVVIACPVTFPPDRIHGRMLSGMGVPDILGTEGTFTYYTSERIDGTKDVGGNLFHVNKSSMMIMNLIGPKVRMAKGAVDNVRVPFKVTPANGPDEVLVEYGGNRATLKTGEWSDWQEVVFKLGLFKKARGIFRFYLIETNPEFKLYISPINFDPRSPFFPISHPAKYSKELANRMGLYYTMGMPMDTWAVNEKRLSEKPFLEVANDVLRERTDMLRFELGRMQKGVLFCYFESPDIIQHMFWRYTDPESPLYEPDAPSEYRNMIRSWYVKLDDVLRMVMDRLEENDILVVLSDHGFGPFRRSVHLNSWLREHGYLKLREHVSGSDSELLQGIDWPATKAYAIGFGAIYINQAGREAGGIVDPGRDTELLKEEIAAELKTWTDGKTGESIVHDVYSREDIFWGAHAGETPDLYVGFNSGYRASWQTALGAVPDGTVEDNLKKWSGTHLYDPNLLAGIILSNKRIIRETPSIYDITPTILKAVGYSEDEIEEARFDGVPLF